MGSVMLEIRIFKIRLFAQPPSVARGGGRNAARRDNQDRGLAKS